MSSLEHVTKYEEYVKQFLSNKYKNIWLWHEIPINILHSLKIIPADQITCDDIEFLIDFSCNVYIDILPI